MTICSGTLPVVKGEPGTGLNDPVVLSIDQAKMRLSGTRAEGGPESNLRGMLAYRYFPEGSMAVKKSAAGTGMGNGDPETDVGIPVMESISKAAIVPSLPLR